MDCYDAAKRKPVSHFYIYHYETVGSGYELPVVLRNHIKHLGRVGTNTNKSDAQKHICGINYSTSVRIHHVGYNKF